LFSGYCHLSKSDNEKAKLYAQQAILYGLDNYLLNSIQYKMDFAVLRGLLKFLYNFDMVDFNEAYALFCIASDERNAFAQFNLGVMYRDGQGVEKDVHKAVQLFRHSADQGNALAQYNLGEMYKDGQGVEKNLEKAKHFFELSANQGYAIAQIGLGGMYFFGHGVLQDFQKAAECFKLAAEQDNEDAQLNLRIMHQEGLIVMKDDVNAIQCGVRDSTAQDNEIEKIHYQMMTTTSTRNSWW